MIRTITRNPELSIYHTRPIPLYKDRWEKVSDLCLFFLRNTCYFFEKAQHRKRSCKAWMQVFVLLIPTILTSAFALLGALFAFLSNTRINIDPIGPREIEKALFVYETAIPSRKRHIACAVQHGIDRYLRKPAKFSRDPSDVQMVSSLVEEIPIMGYNRILFAKRLDLFLTYYQSQTPNVYARIRNIVEQANLQGNSIIHANSTEILKEEFIPLEVVQAGADLETKFLYKSLEKRREILDNYLEASSLSPEYKDQLKQRLRCYLRN